MGPLDTLYRHHDSTVAQYARHYVTAARSQALGRTAPCGCGWGYGTKETACPEALRLAERMSRIARAILDHHLPDVD